MANPNFEGILNRTAGTVERPPTMPFGEYVFKVKGLPELGESAQKKTPQAEFTCIPVAALDGVDEEALEACLNRKSGRKQLGDLVQKLTFYLTEDATYRLKEFLINDLKVCSEAEAEDKTLSELIDMAPNSQFIGTIKHTPTKDGKGVFANIGSTAPYEA